MNKHFFQIIFIAALFCTVNLEAQKKWQTATSSNEYQPWENKPVGSGWSPNTFAFHDFDGDGKTDVFTCFNGNFNYSPGGNSTWKTLSTRFSGKVKSVNQLRFGDFDGDGKTDVFLQWKGNFVYCSGGSGKPVILRKADIPLRHIRLGDFDGDGITDLFVLSH